MVDFEVVITGAVGIATTIIGTYASHIVTKRKYNSEVDSNIISNMQESLEFYQKLSDDNRERLEEVLRRNNALEQEVAELRTQLLNLMSSMCTDIGCQVRKRQDIMPTTKQVKNGTKKGDNNTLQCNS